jgi:hypothetical protein
MTTHINMHQSPLLHIRDADTRRKRAADVALREGSVMAVLEMVIVFVDR